MITVDVKYPEHKEHERQLLSLVGSELGWESLSFFRSEMYWM